MAIGGAAAALVLGLALGGAMRPNLVDDRPAGPQTILGAAATRSATPADSGPSLAAYRGRIPDYVLGTDVTRVAATPNEAATAFSPAPPEPRALDEAPPGPLTRAVYDDRPPALPGRYPSNGAALPTHAPVGQAVDDVDQAPDFSG